MSLFGDDTETAPLNSSLTSKSLFGEQVTPAADSSSSLFAGDGGDASPWDMPTPKKAARKNLIKNLLSATEVPGSYIDAFDTVLNSSDKCGSGVGLTGVKNVLSGSGISPGDQESILNLIIPGGQEPATGLGRSEFNVLLALVGLAQEGDEVTLDGVDDRRRSMLTSRSELLMLILYQGSRSQSSLTSTSFGAKLRNEQLTYRLHRHLSRPLHGRFARLAKTPWKAILPLIRGLVQQLLVYHPHRLLPTPHQ
jgi:hypothetical protein